VARHRKIIAAPNDRDHIADHFRIPQHRANEAHLSLNRDRRLRAKQCCDITTLRFRLGVVTPASRAATASRTVVSCSAEHVR
jgi:hypothetical protein